MTKFALALAAALALSLSAGAADARAHGGGHHGGGHHVGGHHAGGHHPPRATHEHRQRGSPSAEYVFRGFHSIHPPEPNASAAEISVWISSPPKGRRSKA